MTDITLYHFPRACSRVTMTALEEIGLDFETRPVNIWEGEQKKPDYLAIHRMGKVPALKVGAQVRTENAAIIYSLHREYPEAGLLPSRPDGEFDEGLQDLIWCTSTMHPMTRQVRMPARYTATDTDGVRADGLEKYQPVLAMASKRLEGGWWYGDQWSIVDDYLMWNYSTAANGGLDLSGHPAILDHAKRVRARPAFQRVLAREDADAKTLGIDLAPEALG